MFIKCVKGAYYWYQSKRKKKKVVTLYLGKATKQEVKKWQETHQSHSKK